jgi:D-sedoheptulose 7-phosphate isomerase
MDLIKLTKEINNIPADKLDTLRDVLLASDQILLIGNGGSNSIAAHMAVDYTKFLDRKCIANDSSPLMTMLINDYGMENAYSRFLHTHAHPSLSTTAIIISSSGNSENCVQALKMADALGINIIVLSGFNENNKLNSYESPNIKLKYWVDSDSYGVVEMAHHVFLHAIV